MQKSISNSLAFNTDNKIIDLCVEVLHTII